MKKYETPVLKVTVMESVNIITVSGSLAETAGDTQSSFDKVDVEY